MIFLGAWASLLLKAPLTTSEIGGVPVTLIASPYGHCFGSHAGAYVPGSITLGPNGATDEDGRPFELMAQQYSYSFVAPAERGAPVLGLWIQEGGLAYLYDPVEHDEALRYHGVSLNDFRPIVEQLARERGGIRVD